MPNKFHSLLTHPTKECLSKNLNLNDDSEKFLVSARRDLERIIRDGFKAARESNNDPNVQIPLPKFAMQGSYVYRTLISPAHPPDQQVDIDLGVYLPFTALGDGYRPTTNANLLFSTIERILQKYIAKNPGRKWKLITDKDTCVRVILSDTAHIDLPLYAVPDEELRRIEEAVKVQKALRADEGLIFAADEWSETPIEPTTIHLAHRKKGWDPSDALVIRDWVKHQCGEKGGEIRNVCRYLKSWRDETWKSGDGPSSIFLLAHVISVFDKSRSDKHCDLLEQSILGLSNVFDRPLLIPRPTPENKHGTENLVAPERIPQERRTEFQDEFANLLDSYHQARRNDDLSRANNTLIDLFGSRFPYDPSRIEPPTPPSSTTRFDKVSRTPVDRKPLRSTVRNTSG